MTRRDSRFSRQLCCATALSALLVVFVSAAAPRASAQASAQAASQAGGYERAYHQSKAAVEKALKELQRSMGGHLPVLDGFAVPGNHPLSRYQRAYFQSNVEVVSNPSGGCTVRVSTKVTAWYADSAASRSGYELLTSNGRLESDLLDQLSDLLTTRPGSVSADKGEGESFPATAPPAVWAKSPAGADKPVDTAKQKAANTSSANTPAGEPAISAPAPKANESISSALQPGLSPHDLAASKNSQTPTDPTTANLQAQAASLEEVFKNQAHPRNLVAIKKSGTPVVATPSLSGKTLFLASQHDEFEMLDFNADWVHVRISGLSRGWIWRTNLEMPEGLSDVSLNRGQAAPVVADLFQVTREETGPFPGDWEPLRGKNVKIVSVQKIQEDEKNSGAQAKLEYAKFLLDKNYAELSARPQDFAGVVLIFDSVDGGMIALTLPTVQKWKAGTLSDAALWHQCYFDPPETFSVPSPGGGQ
jgi:hypothetical protein